MSQSSQPNWEAHRLKEGVYHVFDADGSGRAYRVALARVSFGSENGYRVRSVSNVSAGRKHTTLDPNGPTARMLGKVVYNQLLR